MTLAQECVELASTGFNLTQPLVIAAIALVVVGSALLMVQRSRGILALVTIALVTVGSLTIAAPFPHSAVAATNCPTGDTAGDSSDGGGDDGGGDGDGGYTPPPDGDGICQWTATPTDPVIGYSGIPTYWIKFDYTSVLEGVQASDCTLQLWYYEDFGGDTDHDPDDPSSWSMNADIAALIGNPTYNPSPGILVWVPGSTTNFIRLKVVDTATSTVVAIYDSNVFDAVPPILVN